MLLCSQSTIETSSSWCVAAAHSTPLLGYTGLIRTRTRISIEHLLHELDLNPIRLVNAQDLRRVFARQYTWSRGRSRNSRGISRYVERNCSHLNNSANEATFKCFER